MRPAEVRLIEAILVCCARSADVLELDLADLVDPGPACARTLTVVARTARVHGCQVFVDGVGAEAAAALRAVGLGHVAAAASAGQSIGAPAQVAEVR
jgi:hypothetical protein